MQSRRNQDGKVKAACAPQIDGTDPSQLIQQQHFGWFLLSGSSEMYHNMQAYP